ncbi:MAG: 50S ribosomal protein L2 [Proteobacteria bacterium]|nr:50S ribosomal protein L2 [Pseudomonadota bacterium]
MPLKQYKPVTSSTRGKVGICRKDLWSGSPVKSLTVGKSSSGGRNNNGRITSWGRGGGVKRKLRLVDFKRSAKLGIEATVERLEYDPGRTAFLALLKYKDDQSLQYVIAPNEINIGSTVISDNVGDIKIGNSFPLINMPVGTTVHCVELKPGKGAQLARSAGSFAQLIGKDGEYALLRLRSGEMRKVPSKCRATIGSVSNSDHKNIKYGKAGRSRWLGIRPTVRGAAMNPVDHPHGGGEGKTSGGVHPKTPWGVPTKGKRTRNNKRTSKYIVRRRYAK